MKIVLEWGLAGARALMRDADVFVIVDVLSFSTCVDIACARGARVFPFPMNDRDAAEREARRLGAELAGRRSDPNSKFSLSAPTLQSIPAGTRLLLPSPNGSRISFAAREKTVFAGCFRNAAAIAKAAAQAARDRTLAVISAGELREDGSLRPAVEDLLGAGAVISRLSGALSPEARAARDAFMAARSDIPKRLEESASGVELLEQGFPLDVEIASALDVSSCAALLVNDAYVAAP